MIIKNRFYFGPVGSIRPLPRQVRGANTTATPERYGPLTRAIQGSPTVVNYGHRRTWPLAWPQMTESEARELARVESAYRGGISRATYFLDTRNTNYLTPDMASCGAYDGTDNFFGFNGTLSRTNSGVFHSDLDGYVDGHLALAGTAIGSRVLGTTYYPVLENANYLFSAYVSGSGTIVMKFLFYDADGVELTSLDSATTVLGPTAVRLSHLAMAGDLPTGAALFRVTLESTTDDPQINTCGWQIQYGETTLKPWYPGAGAAEVVVSAYTVEYPHADKRIVTATFEEV